MGSPHQEPREYGRGAARLAAPPGRTPDAAPATRGGRAEEHDGGCGSDGPVFPDRKEGGRFAVWDAEGGLAVRVSVPGASARVLHPHDYAVQQAVPVLTLAELVALVQIWRMAKQRDSAKAAGAAG